MSAKAVAYAEKTLGVHQVFDNAYAASVSIEQATLQIVTAKSSLREAQEALASAEMDLVQDEWNKHPDMAVSRMESHLKVQRQFDSNVALAKHNVHDAQTALERWDAELTIAKARLSVHTARMEELGGYLHYLAAVKAEQSTQKRTDA